MEASLLFLQWDHGRIARPGVLAGKRMAAARGLEVRSSRVSRARKTSPIPPVPSGLKMRSWARVDPIIAGFRNEPQS
jgi:hypothetical protein